jgi:hypothetical protein
MYLHDDLTITGAGTVVTNTGSTATIGSELGEFVNVVVTNGAQLRFTSSLHQFTFGGNGGGGGTFRLSSPTLQTFGWGADEKFGTMGYYWDFVLAANASSATGKADLFVLGTNATLSSRSIQNNNPGIIARVVFDGGRIWQQNCSLAQRFYAVEGAEVRLEGVNGNPIYLYALSCGTSGLPFFAGVGRLVTIGACDVVLYLADNPIPVMTFSGDIRWRHTGDLRFTGRHIMRLNADHLLPVGTGTGIVRMKGQGTGINLARLDLNGKTTAVNGILDDSAGYSVITNGGQVATLQLGSNGVDAAYSQLLTVAFASSNIVIEKIGQAALTLDRTVPGDLKVSSGRVRIAATPLAASGNVEIAAGASLTVGSDNMPIANNNASEKSAVSLPSFTGEGELAKTGSNTVYCTNLSAYTNGLHIASGTFAVTGVGCSNKFWRFTMKKACTDGTLWLTGLHLVDSSGAYQNTGFTDAEIGTAATNLGPGQVCAPAGSVYGLKDTDGGYAGLSGLFLTLQGDYKEVIWSNTAGKVSLSDPTSWKYFTFRLKNSAGRVFGYIIRTDYWTPSGYPTAWKLESSETGADGTWVTMDERSAAAVDILASVKSKIPNGSYCSCYNWGYPYTLTAGSATGAVSFTAPTAVRVDAGATLDVSGVTDANLAIRGLEAVWGATNGTITKFKPAANGALYLTDVPNNVERTPVTIPYTFGKVLDGNTLRSWTVYVNGVPNRNLSVSIVDGGLKISRGGLVISIR